MKKRIEIIIIKTIIFAAIGCYVYLQTVNNKLKKIIEASQAKYEMLSNNVIYLVEKNKELETHLNECKTGKISIGNDTSQ
jgi:cell division protein FtsB